MPVSFKFGKAFPAEVKVPVPLIIIVDLPTGAGSEKVLLVKSKLPAMVVVTPFGKVKVFVPPVRPKLNVLETLITGCAAPPGSSVMFPPPEELTVTELAKLKAVPFVMSKVRVLDEALPLSKTTGPFVRCDVKILIAPFFMSKVVVAEILPLPDGCQKALPVG